MAKPIYGKPTDTMTVEMMGVKDKTVYLPIKIDKEIQYISFNKKEGFFFADFSADIEREDVDWNVWVNDERDSVDDRINFFNATIALLKKYKEVNKVK